MRARLAANAVIFLAGMALATPVGAHAATGEGTTYHGNGDSMRCPSGIVRIAEIQTFVQNPQPHADPQPIGSASVEVCADNETKYIDIVTRGAPDDVANNGQQGHKSGVDGTIQIHGRTAQLNANIYIPLSDADYTQCARQDDSGQDGSCKPHAQVVSFTGTWVFSLGKWATFRTGADSAGSPVVIAARVLSGPVE
ncbi:hypothetical protein HW511_01460 [Asaia siamensis]|uniref:hypothetical protein n=1 Tax=Asaia siamensis TaxID=110479 RepID=UPI002FC3CC56